MREGGDSDKVHLTFRETKFYLARRNPKISIKQLGKQLSSF